MNSLLKTCRTTSPYAPSCNLYSVHLYLVDEAPASGLNLEHSIQYLVMGGALEAITRAGQRNRDEGRIVMVRAVCERP